MTEKQGNVETGYKSVIMEVKLILPTIQFFALEEAAYRRNLSVAQLLRRAIADLLQQSESVSGG